MKNNNNLKRFKNSKPIEVYHAVNDFTSDPHWHFGYLITLNDDGEGVEVKNGIKYPAIKGKVSVLSPSDIHYNEVKQGGFISYYGIKFSPNIYSGVSDSYFSKLNFPLTAYLKGDDYDEALFIFKMIEKYSKKNIENSKVVITSLLDLLLKIVSDSQYVSNETIKVNSISSAIIYLKCHFTENILQSELASMCGFSVDYFGRLFKKETGIGFTQYLLSLRLDCAARLLLAGANAQEACYNSGFSSYNWFSYSFTRKFKVSPGKYAKNI